MNVRNRSARWGYLVLGVIVLLFTGIIYAWSILKAPLAAEFGWTASQLSLNYTLTMSFFCLGGVAGSILSGRFGTKVTLLLAAIFSCGGLVLASWITGSSIAFLYLSYGFLCSLGIGMAYNTVLSTVCAWFPDKMGLCSGCLMMGFGASTMIMGSVADAMINDPEIGWRTAYAFLGIALGVMLLVACLVLRRPAADAKQDQKDASEAEERTSYSPGQMLRRSSFWRGFLYLMFLSAVGSTVISFAKDLSLSVGASAALSTMLVGVLSICNGLGRIITGIAFDALGQRKTMLAANIIALAAAVVVLVAIRVSSVPVCVLGLCVTGLSYGASPTISSTFTSSFYGPKYFSTNLSITGINLMGAAGIASVASVLTSASGGYTAPMLMLLALTIVGLLLNISIRKP